MQEREDPPFCMEVGCVNEALLCESCAKKQFIAQVEERLDHAKSKIEEANTAKKKNPHASKENEYYWAGYEAALNYVLGLCKNTSP